MIFLRSIFYVCHRGVFGDSHHISQDSLSKNQEVEEKKRQQTESSKISNISTSSIPLPDNVTQSISLPQDTVVKQTPEISSIIQSSPISTPTGVAPVPSIDIFAQMPSAVDIPLPVPVDIPLPSQTPVSLSTIPTPSQSPVVTTSSLNTCTSSVDNSFTPVSSIPPISSAGSGSLPISCITASSSSSISVSSSSGDAPSSVLSAAASIPLPPTTDIKPATTTQNSSTTKLLDSQHRQQDTESSIVQPSEILPSDIPLPSGKTTDTTTSVSTTKEPSTAPSESVSSLFKTSVKSIFKVKLPDDLSSRLKSTEIEKKENEQSSPMDMDLDSEQEASEIEVRSAQNAKPKRPRKSRWGSIEKKPSATVTIEAAIAQTTAVVQAAAAQVAAQKVAAQVAAQRASLAVSLATNNAMAQSVAQNKLEIKPTQDSSVGSTKTHDGPEKDTAISPRPEKHKSRWISSSQSENVSSEQKTDPVETVSSSDVRNDKSREVQFVYPPYDFEEIQDNIFLSEPRFVRTYSKLDIQESLIYFLLL